MKKNIQGMMKTISFSILFSTLQFVLIVHFFTFLQQLTAGEKYKVAGNSAGRGAF